MGSGREFADGEHFVPAIRATFGPSRALRGVVRLPGGTNKGVYRLSFADGPSVLGYRWQQGEDYWPASFYDDGPFATTRSDGHTLFTTAHARLTTLDVRVPHLLYDDGHDTVLVEDVTGGTLEALLRSDPTAGSAALAALRRMLDRMHADTSVGIGHAGDDFPGLTCERFALDRGLACLTEATARVPRIAAAQTDLERALRRRVDQITPRTTHRLIHGELGPDHVMIDDAGQPVLIDIEGITFFDVEWEHAFLELRFASNYEPLRAPSLDSQRLELYRLVHHLSLTAGPLMLLDGDFPHRDIMQRISDALRSRVTSSAPSPAAKHRGQPVDGPKVWCSPSIDAAARDRLRTAGVNVVANLSKYVTAMVVAEVDESDPRVVRGRAAGKRLVLSTSVPELIRTAGETAATSSLPHPDPGARQPPPWSVSMSHEATG